MEYGSCNVVYVNRRAREDRLIRREASSFPGSIQTTDGAAVSSGGRDGHGLDIDLENLLGTFSEVYVCSSGSSCVSKLSDLNETSSLDLIPTLILIDIPYDDPSPKRPSHGRTPSPTSNGRLATQSDTETDASFYGLPLLQWISSEIQQKNYSKLMVPVAVVAVPQQVDFSSSPPREMIRTASNNSQHHRSKMISTKAASVTLRLDQQQTMRYLDIGAVDVLISPLSRERLPSLAIHAYRAHKETSNEHNALMELRRGRKRSWVGLDDQKPYAYLREAMVSGLMDGICRSGDDAPLLGAVHLSISEERREKIKSMIGIWEFSAHDLSDEELLLAAVYMLQHTLELPELEQWRITADALTAFLTACRSAYNAFVPYHNFRHVIDVMQATFTFITRIGAIPNYPYNEASVTAWKTAAKSPIAAMIRPFDALTLLITAIGHDVGHPGVNNAFLVTLSAPLAQLYNDRSVLEAFHCAAYSQILRRYWPAAFSAVEMRQLMISSILATDMGLHFDYMKKMGFLEEKLHENKGTDGWNGRQQEEYRTLACSLLIKCADISNVARRYDIASQWTMILIDEFSRQASMEADLGIPSALFAPPVREIIELGKSQIGFINMFAIPLFQGVTNVMPAMQFSVDELHRNITIWEGKIEAEQAKRRKHSQDSVTKDGMLSPRAMSFAKSVDQSQQGSGSRNGSRNGSNARSISSSHSKAEHPLSKSVLSTDEFNFDFKSLSEANTNNHIENDVPTDPLVPVLAAIGSVSSKPVLGQLRGIDTVGVPGLFDHPVLPEEVLQSSNHVNGISVNHFVPTDGVVSEAAHTTQKETKSGYQNRSSETTQESMTNSLPGSNDWASQATSATTNRQPISPSTQGTSIVSDEEDLSEKPQPTSAIVPLLGREILSRNCAVAPPKGEFSPMGAEPYGPYIPRSPTSEIKSNSGSSVTVIESMRSLAKKPSKSRFRFWRRTKTDEPPVPTSPVSTGSSGGIEERVKRM